MKEIIEDIWILTKAGVPMFYLNEPTKKDKGQVSCILSALSIWIDAIHKSEQFSIETLSDKLTLKYCHNGQVIVGVITKKNTKEKKILPQLNTLCRLIEGFFGNKDFFNFNGDTAEFQDLATEIMALDAVSFRRPVLIH